VVPEAELQQTDHGLVPTGDGWFVLNARDSRWYHGESRGAFCDFEGDQDFPQVGVNLQVLMPGQPMAMYHWEVDQEDFLVLSGEALLIVEGEERTLRAWDFFHCASLTKHTIVGAGDGPCVVVAIGARANQEGPDWGGYTADETAARHGVGVEEDTNEPEKAYANWIRRQHAGYQEGWLP
jgi:uncharacterized cupin superfamily protein